MSVRFEYWKKTAVNEWVVCVLLFTHGDRERVATDQETNRAISTFTSRWRTIRRFSVFPYKYYSCWFSRRHFTSHRIYESKAFCVRHVRFNYFHLPRTVETPLTKSFHPPTISFELIILFRLVSIWFVHKRRHSFFILMAVLRSRYYEAIRPSRSHRRVHCYCWGKCNNVIIIILAGGTRCGRRTHMWLVI